MPDEISGSVRSLYSDDGDERLKTNDPILGSLGERAILSEILIPRLVTEKAVIGNIGDDCAEIALPPDGHTLLVTTDPCPSPIVFELEDHDYWHYGHMTILINVSDLAAMGASPKGIVVSTVMPNDMRLSDYHRYLDGLIEAADEWNCPIVGGNIKDGPEFTSSGTAFGSAPARQVMRRTGACEGDMVCVVGKMGLFWAAILQRLSPVPIDVPRECDSDLWQALHRPTARLREAQVLAHSRLVTACMDASDGVGACLTELATRNRLDIIVDGACLIPDQPVDRVANEMQIDPRKLMLAWGNWELVFSVKPESVNSLLELARVYDFPVSVIGEMRKGAGSVLLLTDSGLKRVNNFASERFTTTSYFSYGLESYMQWLIDTPLTQEGPI